MLQNISNIFTINLATILWKRLRNYKAFITLAFKYKDYDILVIKDRNDGFFSIYFQAICAYRIARFNRQKVSFQFDIGSYYDSRKGNTSWWSYYFKYNQISIDCQAVEKDSSAKNIIVNSIEEQHKLALTGAMFSRETAHKIIKDNFLKKEILDKIHSFKENEFKGCFIVGLHYRGTDKVSGRLRESTRVDYSTIGTILDKIVSFGFPFRLFIATDEEDFLEYLKARNDLSICFTNSSRSANTKPLHLSRYDRGGYELGAEALIDSILLSESDFLIRTDSNLSQASLFFNPLLKSVNISQVEADPNKYKDRLASIGNNIANAYRRKISDRANYFYKNIDSG